MSEWNNDSLSITNGGNGELEWISIKDQLPPEKTFNSIFIVALHSSYKNKLIVQPLHYISGKWYEMNEEEPLSLEYDVTHWMPLPEPPKD